MKQILWLGLISVLLISCSSTSKLKNNLSLHKDSSTVSVRDTISTKIDSESFTVVIDTVEKSTEVLTLEFEPRQDSSGIFYMEYAVDSSATPVLHSNNGFKIKSNRPVAKATIKKTVSSSGSTQIDSRYSKLLENKARDSTATVATTDIKQNENEKNTFRFSWFQAVILIFITGVSCYGLNRLRLFFVKKKDNENEAPV